MSEQNIRRKFIETNDDFRNRNYNELITCIEKEIITDNEHRHNRFEKKANKVKKIYTIVIII